ncbi:MAG: hypothetical protein ACPGN3_09705, partial [Opitutales bacterium]
GALSPANYWCILTANRHQPLSDKLREISCAIFTFTLFLLGSPALLADYCSEEILVDSSFFSTNIIPVTNGYGLLIEGDAVTSGAAYERDAIRPVHAVTFRLDASLTSGSDEFYAIFKLLDSGGDAVTILNEGKSTDSIRTENLTVSLEESRPSITQFFAADLEPESRLDPLESYSVEVTVYRNLSFGGCPGGVPTGRIIGFQVDSATSTPTPILHFTNTDPGDSEQNVIAVLDNGQFDQTYAIDTAATSEQTEFTIDLNYSLWRYDDFTSLIPSTHKVEAVFDVELFDNNGNPVAISPSTFVIQQSLKEFENTNPKTPSALFDTNSTIAFAPAEQLDSVNNTFYARVTLSSREIPGSAASDLAWNSEQTSSASLIHLDGTLYFGSESDGYNGDDIRTTLTATSLAPLSTGISGGTRQLILYGTDGFVNNSPDHTYSLNDGKAIRVNLYPNGDAWFTEPEPGDFGVVDKIFISVDEERDLFTFRGTRFERQDPSSGNNDVELGTSGAVSNLTLLLPTGLGFASDPSDHTWSTRLRFSNETLSDSLEPKFTEYSVEPGIDFWIHEESQPLVHRISRLRWDASSGQANWSVILSGETLWVREDETNFLAGLNASPWFLSPQSLRRPSNEGYFSALDSSIPSTQFYIEVDSYGTAMVSTDAYFTAGSFPTHFPYASEISWTGPGQLYTYRDDIDSASSALTNSAPLVIRSLTGCSSIPGSPCTIVAPESFYSLLPDFGNLFFTRDGGLWSTGNTSTQSVNHPRWGTVTPTNNLEWGYIDASPTWAHRVEGVDRGNFHMPGVRIDGEEYGSFASDRAAAVMLLSGMSDPVYDGRVERPFLTPDPYHPYAEGFSDYAGINFTMADQNSYNTANAYSVLGGEQTGAYTLDGVAKYYLRTSGLTGRHQSILGDSSDQWNLRIYGYDVTLTSFALAFLSDYADSRGSRTSGNVYVDYPADFGLDFSKLEFTCLGDLGGAELPPAVGTRTLNYWRADIEPLSLAFVRDPLVECSPGNGTITLGVRTGVAHVPDPLFLTMGFKDDGNIVSRAMSEADPAIPDFVNGELYLPSTVSLRGPSKGNGNFEQYNITTTGVGYFNHYGINSSTPTNPWDVLPSERPDTGFAAFAGTIDVPFFNDLRVHVHTSAEAGSEIAPIFMMGGWNESGNFWDNQSFDTEHRGFPGTTDAGDYRSGGSGDEYRVRAQRNWLGVDLSYPLAWKSGGRSFNSTGKQEADFLVISAYHQMLYLSAENAELAAGATYEGLPRINLANLAINAIDASTGVKSALEDTISEAVSDLFNTGTSAMQRLTADLAGELFEDAIEAAVQEQVTIILDQLDSAYDAANDQWTIDYSSIADIFAGQTLAEKLHLSLKGDESGIQLASASSGSQLPSVINKIKDELIAYETALLALSYGVDYDGDGDVILDPNFDTAPGFPGILYQNPLGDYAIGSSLVFNLIETLSPDVANALKSGLGSSLTAPLATLLDAEVNQYLESAKPTLGAVRQSIEEIRGVIQEVRARLDEDGEFFDELCQIYGGATIDLPAPEFQEIANAVEADIVSFIDDLQANNDRYSDYTRQEIEDYILSRIQVRFLETRIVTDIQEAIRHRVFDFEEAANEAIDSAFAQFNQVIRKLIGTTLAEIDATIVPFLDDIAPVVGGASLEGYAHINGDALKLLRIDLKMQLNVPDPMNFHGYLQIKQLDSDGDDSCGVSAPGVTFNEVLLGANDVPVDWISPSLRANIWGKFIFIDSGSSFGLGGMGGGFDLSNGPVSFESFSAGSFGASLMFGKTENYLAAEANLRFDGFKAAGGLFFGQACSVAPLEMVDPDVLEVLGPPPFTGVYVYAECHMPIFSAGCLFEISAGVGAGAFYFAEGPTYGGKILLAASGEALCVVSIKGEITLIGLKHGNDFRFKGKGRFSGKVGWCPFCIKFGKTVSATYAGGDWDVDF